MTSAPNQIHGASGFTLSRSTAALPCASARSSPSTAYRSRRPLVLMRASVVVMRCTGKLRRSGASVTTGCPSRLTSMVATRAE